MRYLFTFLLATAALTSCSKQKASDLDGLSAHVEAAIRENQPEKIVDLVYDTGGDAEINKMWAEIIGSMDLDLNFAVGEIDGQWRIIGVAYADRAFGLNAGSPFRC